MLAAFSQRTWFELRTAARSAKRHFNTRWTKAQAFEHLRSWLADEGVLRRTWRGLPSSERRALQTLQAAGGIMPRHRFSRDFGALRPCRQRPVEEGWAVPQNPAERLWLAGFIEIERGERSMIHLTVEGAAVMPPLPVPQPSPHPPTLPGVWTRAALVIDVTAFIGALLAEDMRPVHRRWLSPSALRAVNQRMAHPQNLAGIRSERAAGRIAFLHYTALVTDLISIQAGLLKPTPAAWDWLGLPVNAAWDRVWTAIQRDHAVNGWWKRFGLPDVDAETWQALCRALEMLNAGTYTTESLFETTAPYLPPHQAARIQGRMRQLINTVFTWMGWAAWERDRVTVHPRTHDIEQSSALHHERVLFVISLSAQPCRAALVEVLAWARADHWMLTIDQDAVRRAVGQGLDVVAITRALSSLCGALPPSVFQQIKAWMRAARSLKLRRMTVLTADDPVLLNQICADWRLRPLLDAPLSRHHLAVRADQADVLARKLERRGLPVTQTRGSLADQPTGDALYAYLYVAVQTYRQLSEFAAQPITLPASVRRWLADQLPPHQLDALNDLATRTLDSLAQAINGAGEPPPFMPSNAEEVSAAVQQAYGDKTEIEIDYFSPTRGDTITRTIEPYHLYERGGARYVEAWCGHDRAARTFRFDRVLRAAMRSAPEVRDSARTAAQTSE